MNESFSELFQKSLESAEVRPGKIVNGVVTNIDDKFVSIDVGLKSEGAVPLDQFQVKDGVLEVEPGDKIDVVIEQVADAYGETRLSREKAKRIASWAVLVDAHEKGEVVKGTVQERVKGGFVVDIQSVQAFLPGSLVDVRPMTDTSWLEGKEFDFKIIKVDEKRNNIVVSRRALLEAENAGDRDKVLKNLEEGKSVKGVVKNLTDYGAFIDLGGIDGLLHITDIAWKRVKVPSDVLNIGDEIEVMVLKIDPDSSRVSLGMKQLHQNPWENVKERFPQGKKLTGKVTNITDYGCFVELEEGIEGLVHMSEMDWTNKNVHPSKLVKEGDEVEVIVLDIDVDRRRVSLGMKQCSESPWNEFASQHEKGERVKGHIRSITDFGIFIGLDGSIDGLVHISDISWDQPGEEAIREYKKGQELEAVILSIDSERERISLGIKQLRDDPFMNYVNDHPKGSVVKGKITTVEEREAFVELANEVIGRIKISELSKDKIDSLKDHLKEGDELEAKIISINQKSRVINLSVRAKEEGTETNKEAGSSKKQPAEKITNTKLGDLLKEKIKVSPDEASEALNEDDEKVDGATEEK